MNSGRVSRSAAGSRRFGKLWTCWPVRLSGGSKPLDGCTPAIAPFVNHPAHKQPGRECDSLTGYPSADVSQSVSVRTATMCRTFILAAAATPACSRSRLIAPRALLELPTSSVMPLAPSEAGSRWRSAATNRAGCTAVATGKAKPSTCLRWAGESLAVPSPPARAGRGGGWAYSNTCIGS